MSFLDVLYFIIPSAIFYAAPLIFIAIGGVFSERSGVINIGLEGLMVMGAFIGILFNLMFVITFLGNDSMGSTNCSNGCFGDILHYACCCIDFIPCRPNNIRGCD